MIRNLDDFGPTKENTRYREKILFLMWKFFTAKEERLILGLKMVNIHCQKNTYQISIVLMKEIEMHHNFCPKIMKKKWCQEIKILILELDGCLNKI